MFQGYSRDRTELIKKCKPINFAYSVADPAYVKFLKDRIDFI
nr:MAG TPA: hypothetical protein [Bacteriophage sp.]